MPSVFPSAMVRILRRWCCLVVLSLGIAGAASTASAQELDCRVTVNYAAVTGTEYAFLADLADQIEIYLNQRAWTEDRFQEYERIACTFTVTIIEAETLDRFRARLTVGSQRPIWGVPGRTTVFQAMDSQWHFTYNRGQALVFDLNRFDSLTSVIDFYAFLILGYDYDTFDELGGTQYFQQARRVADLAQAQGASDWQSIGEDQSRATLARQLLDTRFERLRRAYFLYHFGGLDAFTRDHSTAWESAAAAIAAIHELYQESSRRYAIDVFFAAKSSEIPELFGDYPDRAGLYALLVDMDPGRASAYDRLTR
jgi:hypothetical protein